MQMIMKQYGKCVFVIIIAATLISLLLASNKLGLFQNAKKETQNVSTKNIAENDGYENYCEGKTPEIYFYKKGISGSLPELTTPKVSCAVLKNYFDVKYDTAADLSKCHYSISDVVDESGINCIEYGYANFPQAGVYSITVTATDSEKRTSKGTFRVIVN